jgi:hypothetical protein
LVHENTKRVEAGLALSSDQHKPIDESAEISTMPHADVPETPVGPEITPKLKLHAHQKIGIPLLLLIPILAILGLFGVNTNELQAEAEDVSISVQYPTRFRYRQINTIEVGITNNTDDSLQPVTAYFDREYIDHFANADFTPQVSHITETAYIVELEEMPAGETYYINVEIEAHDVGYHRGEIRVEADSTQSTQVEVETLVFP